MTWAEVETIIRDTLVDSGEHDPIYGERQLAEEAVRRIREELVRRNWKGGLKDDDMAFYGSFEKAKR
jgi:hypothetical protein